MDWRNLLRENAVGLGVVLVGVLMVGMGVWQAVVDNGRAPEIIPVESEAAAHDPVVVVEIAGAVTKPGVYEVEWGTRLVDLIGLAEGMADTADTEWVAKTLNQAERLKDGQKVYIPAISETEFDKDEGVGTERNESGSSQVLRVAGATLVNVNTATLQELEELWGVGEARAKAIIENRPYASLEELKTKAKIPDSVLERNEGKMSVF